MEWVLENCGQAISEDRVEQLETDMMGGLVRKVRVEAPPASLPAALSGQAGRKRKALGVEKKSVGSGKKRGMISLICDTGEDR